MLGKTSHQSPQRRHGHRHCHGNRLRTKSRSKDYSQSDQRRSEKKTASLQAEVTKLRESFKHPAKNSKPGAPQPENSTESASSKKKKGNKKVNKKETGNDGGKEQKRSSAKGPAPKQKGNINSVVNNEKDSQSADKNRKPKKGTPGKKPKKRN